MASDGGGTHPGAGNAAQGAAAGSVHASGRPDETGPGRTGDEALAQASGRPMVNPPMVNPRPTMRDVASAAGVSLMTFSRVVNGESGVLPETVVSSLA